MLWIRQSFLFLGAALIASGAALAQSNSARLTGAVTDTTGAVVPGATITLTNVGTQRSVTATSDGVGNYSIPALPPGSYGVEVKATGFKGLKQQLTLDTQQVAAVNFQLEVGSTTESITVTQNVPLVESASSSLSDVVIGKQITDLPLNGRNITQLATLVPGVNRGLPTGQATGVGNNAETFRYSNTGGASLSVNGLRPQNNNFLLDGIDNNESLVNTIIFFPPADAVQEFRVDTSVAPAEFGRAGGAVVNTTFRSGTNALHGSAFYFGRNSVFDASPEYFSPTTAKPEFRRHQFGGTIGGAIIKDKLFFFGDYQGLRQALPIDAGYRATVPTALMRTGNFSDLLTLASPIQIKDPITGAPLPGNIIPSKEIVTPGTNYLNAFPLPNISGSSPDCGLANSAGACIQQNYLVNRTQVQHFNDFDVRVDYNIEQKDTVFGRYSYGKDDEITGSRFPNLPAGFGAGVQNALPRSFALGETHTFNSTVLNEFRFGWIHTQIGFTPPFNNVPLSQRLGIPNANTSPLLGGGALIGGDNTQIEYTGDYGPYIVPEQTWQFSDGLSWVKGNHTFKFGAQILRRQVNFFRPFAGKGFFLLYGNGAFPSPTGYEVSDLLAGWMDQYQVGPTLGFSHTRSWETGYFAQDDWQVTHRLTLNLGIRYDLFTWPIERNNLQSNFNLNYVHPQANPPKLLLAGVDGNSQSLIPTPEHNFAPRIGFAYKLTDDAKTVLRGGFGIFYFLDRGGINNQLAQNAPFQGLSIYQYSQGVRINLAGQAPANSTNPTLAGTVAMPSKGQIAIDPNNPAGVSLTAYPRTDTNSSTQEWNLQVQRELGANMSASVAYVGVHSVHLMTFLDYNRQAYAEPSGVKQNFQQLADINANVSNGTGSYNALQMQLLRRLANGVQFSAAYTFSHNIDDSPGTLDNQAGYVDYFNFAHERANSNLDIKHNLVLTALCELPFGRGKMFGGDWKGFRQELLGGWQVSPIFTYQSGLPFDVLDNRQAPNTRPDIVGPLQTIGSLRTWFNTSAFSDPPIVNGSFARPGTGPRNPFFGPTRKFLDMSIAKNFDVTERVKTEFRAEFYNLSNTPQFSQPDGQISDGTFGQISSILQSTERQIEFALRVTF